jgi:hypothetical protein
MSGAKPYLYFYWRGKLHQIFIDKKMRVKYRDIPCEMVFFIYPDGRTLELRYEHPKSLSLNALTAQWTGGKSIDVIVRYFKDRYGLTGIILQRVFPKMISEEEAEKIASSWAWMNPNIREDLEEIFGKKKVAGNV